MSQKVIARLQWTLKDKEGERLGLFVSTLKAVLTYPVITTETEGKRLAS